uniref:growth hormone secretagogue receptor type 1-like n=1 Tax=Ciona intestinalis TaxID=7719 RepID=UPI000EF4432E|nr:growth hormone secretagogue receptor type 1-like [Ciona intestinalis]|eukprot:XP_026696399.1 growth hormone secretagogue receptor type 1-like [Ciona intestinalis]
MNTSYTEVFSTAYVSEETTVAAALARRPYVRPFNNTEVIITATILFTLCVVGITGNVITIAVIGSRKSLSTIFNIFILSLCVSDLYSALISPLQLYRRTWGFDRWIISDFLCKFYWGSDLWTSFVTATHIASFALLRLASIGWPHRFAKVRMLSIKIFIIAVWSITFAVGFVPFSVFMESAPRNRSSNHVSSRWPSCTCAMRWVGHCKWYSHIAYPIFFYLPLVTVVITSVVIAIFLWRRRFNTFSANRQTDVEAKKEKQAIIQLFLIVGSFLVGYIPFTAYAFYTQYPGKKGDNLLRIDWLFGIIQYICMRTSECLNPIFYNIGSSKMRVETKRFLEKCFCGRSVSKTNNTVSSSKETNGKLETLDSKVPENFDDPVIIDERPL